MSGSLAFSYQTLYNIDTYRSHSAHCLDFHGKQIIYPQDVHEKDSRTVGFLGKLRHQVPIQKYRDMIRRIIKGMNVILVALENQDLVHYAMPIRVMMDDAAGYDEQMLTFPDVDLFQTDLREVFGFFQRSEDKYAVQQFVNEHKMQFEHLDEDAYDMITALTNTKEFTDKKEIYREEGSRINMCRAIKELIEDGKSEGSQRINELNRRLLADGRQDDMIRAVQDEAYQKSLLNEYNL